MRFIQKTGLSSQRILKKSLLGLFTALICALFAAGCSSSDNGTGGFVASPADAPGGGGGASAGNGSVTFNFVKAQTNPIVVPTNTVNLRFEFFTGLEGTGVIVLNETRPFAASITFDNVPSSARSSRVTAYTAEGFPISQFTSNQSVPPNGTVIVGTEGGTTVPIVVDSVVSSPVNVSVAVGDTFQPTVKANFSNGETIALSGALTSEVTFVSNNLGVATVAPDGTITGVADGSASISATFQGQAVTIPVAVGNGVVSPPLITDLTLTTVEGQPLSLPVGTVSQPVTVTATYDTGDTAIVTQADGVTFSTTNANIEVNGSGQIAVSVNATVGASAQITANYQAATSNPVVVDVNAAILQTLTVEPASISLPYGGFEETVSVTGNFSDGNSNTLDPDTAVSFGVSGGAFSVDDVTGLVTSDPAPAPPVNPSTGDLTIATIGQNPNLNTTVPVTVGDIYVQQLTVAPEDITLAPGGVQEFTVTAQLSAGDPVDVSDFASLVLDVVPGTNPGPNITLNGRQVVATGVSTASGSPVQINFTIAGAGFNGGDAVVTTDVTVLAEFLVSAVYQFGGIDIPTGGATAPAVNLPRGYVGLVEVIGTFNTGVVRQLKFNEYSLTMEAAATANDGLIELFDDSYAIDPIHADFQNGVASDADGFPGPAYDAANAVSDDTYITQRQAVPIVGGVPVGSNSLQVATRNTYRAIAAGWQRGERFRGSFDHTGRLLADPADPARVTAPGAVRNFNILIDPSVADPADPNALDLQVQVTVIDPKEVTFQSLAFKNYEDESRTPTGTVRELDIRVQFSRVAAADTFPTDANPPSYGPFTSAPIDGWKLAEANVLISSASGGANPFAGQIPTSLGGLGVFSDQNVNINVLTVATVPLGGFGVRPILLQEPTLVGADYTAGSYLLGDRTYGAHNPFTTVESPGNYVALRDPGPPNPDQAAMFEREPADSLVFTVTEVPGTPIVFAMPSLFSIDPINPAGLAAPLQIANGATQIFRTLVRFDGENVASDRSLDYPPTLIVGGTPAFIGRRELSNGASTGRLLVSGINELGTDVAGADVTAQTGFPNLMNLPQVSSALNFAQGIVIALDAVGEPIDQKGAFTVSAPDALGATGNAQNTTTIDIAP